MARQLFRRTHDSWSEGDLSVGFRSPSRYRQVLQRAAKLLPHIHHGKISKKSRIKTSITYYDIYESHTAEAVKVATHDPVPASFRNIGTVPEGVIERVFVVEDLSDEVIHALGEAFDVTPEFFEEHLLNSGYCGAEYDDPPARSWVTAGLAKSYSSIQWFRPVHRLPPQLSELDRKDLLEGGLDFELENSEFHLETNCNIFRSEWDLRTDIAREIGGPREIALVERASIWTQRSHTGPRIVIVLVDPLPKVKTTQKWTAPVPEIINAHGSGHSSLEEPASPSRSDSIVSGIQVLRIQDESPPCEIPAEPPRRDPQANPFAKLLENVFQQRTRPPQSGRKLRLHCRQSSQVLVQQMSPRKVLTLDLERALVTGDSIDILEHNLTDTRSTSREIGDRIRSHGQPMNVGVYLLEIIQQDTLTLLEFLQQAVSRIEEDILDEIKMEDRLTIWRRLISRAQQDLPELKTSISTFVDATDVIGPRETSRVRTEDSPRGRMTNGTDRSTEIGASQYTKPLDLFREIDETLNRLRDASVSLTSNMGLLESRRSIDEAHAVARLTELAFIFIPLSFSTSVFGMQIEPFADNAPLWKFFMVAGIAVTFAYLMRLIMRSTWLTHLKVKVKADVRRYAERKGDSIQVRSISILLLLQWLASKTNQNIRFASSWTFLKSTRAFHVSWTHLWFPARLLLLIGGVVVIPLAVLWTSNLDPGIQGSVSLAVIFLAISIVGLPFFWVSLPTLQRSLPVFMWHIRKSFQAWTFREYSLLLAGVSLVVLSLALIWTHSLPTGTRAGLTVAILVTVSVGTFVVRQRVTLLARQQNSHDTESDSGGSSYYSYSSSETRSRTTPDESVTSTVSRSQPDDSSLSSTTS